MTFHELVLVVAGFLLAVSLGLMYRIWILREEHRNRSDATFQEQYEAIMNLFYGHANIPMGRDEVYALLMYISELKAESES